jgi:hypothetical protein
VVGTLFLGLSRLYRGGGQENAGSVAAMLAGWSLLLYYGAQAVSRYNALAASLLLAGLLALWLARPAVARVLAHRRH